MHFDLDRLADFRIDEDLPSLMGPDAKLADTDGIVEIAGRLCYMSYGKGRKSNQEFIKHILDVGHGSVLEHAVFGFIFTNVSRSFTHELVRHRHLSFSQLSQRYVDESDAGVIEPPDIAADESMHGTFMRATQSARTAYAVLVSNLELRFKHIENATQRRKMARQAARAVLPNATRTKIFVTGNARAWRHFIEVRGSVFADAEIRTVAVEVCRILKDASPHIFGDYQIVEQDGVEIVETRYEEV